MVPLPDLLDVVQDLVSPRITLSILDSGEPSVHDAVDLESTRRIDPAPNTTDVLVLVKDGYLEARSNEMSCRADTGDACADDSDTTQRLLVIGDLGRRG